MKQKKMISFSFIVSYIYNNPREEKKKMMGVCVW
jgi:hypothetical protein